MKEKRMKTSVSTGEVSLPPAQAVGWGVKIGKEHGGGTEKRGFGTPNLLAKPCEGRIIAKTTGKT
jgi:hypothetical protein